MTKVGITGHVYLTRRSERLVYDGLVAALHEYAGPALLGVTCLAEGADQLFARAVTAAGGTYEVILPARDYRHRCISAARIRAFDDLLERAQSVSYACSEESGEQAYVAANEELVRRSDVLIAVWDGKPTHLVSGTARVVALADERGLPVIRVWPSGTRRSASPLAAAQRACR